MILSSFLRNNRYKTERTSLFKKIKRKAYIYQEVTYFTPREKHTEPRNMTGLNLG